MIQRDHQSDASSDAASRSAGAATGAIAPPEQPAGQHQGTQTPKDISGDAHRHRVVCALTPRSLPRPQTSAPSKSTRPRIGRSRAASSMRRRAIALAFQEKGLGHCIGASHGCDKFAHGAQHFGIGKRFGHEPADPGLLGHLTVLLWPRAVSISTGRVAEIGHRRAGPAECQSRSCPATSRRASPDQATLRGSHQPRHDRWNGFPPPNPRATARNGSASMMFSSSSISTTRLLICTVLPPSRCAVPSEASSSRSDALRANPVQSCQTPFAQDRRLAPGRHIVLWADTAGRSRPAHARMPPRRRLAAATSPTATAVACQTGRSRLPRRWRSIQTAPARGPVGRPGWNQHHPGCAKRRNSGHSGQARPRTWHRQSPATDLRNIIVPERSQITRPAVRPVSGSAANRRSTQRIGAAQAAASARSGSHPVLRNGAAQPFKRQGRVIAHILLQHDARQCAARRRSEVSVGSTCQRSRDLSVPSRFQALENESHASVRNASHLFLRRA